MLAIIMTMIILKLDRFIADLWAELDKLRIWSV